MNSKELERFIKIADQMMTDNEDVRLNAATRCYEMLVRHKMLWRDVISLVPKQLHASETPEVREHRRIYNMGLSYGYQSGLCSAAPLDYEQPAAVRTEDISLPAVFKEGERAGYDDGFNDALRYGGYVWFLRPEQEPEQDAPEVEDGVVRKIMGVAGRITDVRPLGSGVLVTLISTTQKFTAFYKGGDLPAGSEGVHCVARIIPGTPPVISHILARQDRRQDKARRA